MGPEVTYWLGTRPAGAVHLVRGPPPALGWGVDAAQATEDPRWGRRPRCRSLFSPASPCGGHDTHMLGNTDDSPWQSLRPARRRPTAAGTSPCGGLTPHGKAGPSPGTRTFQRLLRRVTACASGAPTRQPLALLARPPRSSLTSVPRRLGPPAACLPALASAPSLGLPGSLSNLLKRCRK